jgi:hypothetical protein
MATSGSYAKKAFARTRAAFAVSRSVGVDAVDRAPSRWHGCSLWKRWRDFGGGG